MKLVKTIIIYVVVVGFIYYIIDRVFNSNESKPPVKTEQPAMRYLPNGEVVSDSDEAVSLDVIGQWTKVYANQTFINNENGLETEITFISSDEEETNLVESMSGTMELIQGSCIFTFFYSQRGNVIDATYESSTCNRRKSSNIKIIVNKEKKQLSVEIGGQVFIFKPVNSLTTGVEEDSGCYNNSNNQKTTKCDVCGIGRFDENGTCTHCDAVTAEKERYYAERLPNCEVCGGDGIEDFGRNQIICRICNGKGKQTY